MRVGTDGRHPTLETVAAEAGVSRATVSRVVNLATTVSPAVRDSVEAAIARLGYVPNRAARSLVTRRTGSVAVVMREPAEFGVADPYLASLVVAAGQSLIGTGTHMVVLMAPSDDEDPWFSNFLRSGVADGVLLLSTHDGDPLPDELVRAGIPLVVAGRLPRRMAGVTVVDVDNVAGGRAAAGRLLSTGRRQVATIAGPPDMPAAVDRLSGFRNALAAAGRPADVLAYGAWTLSSGERATADLLAREPGIDGLFAANDLMAIGAIRALRHAGRRVPGDVAVIGYDDIDIAANTDPPLTTIRQPAAEMTRTMIDLLLRRVKNESVPDTVLLPVELVVRSSG
ncbi:MAG: LacI family DNA-binding transcriptional regulator [Dermatophilaceae bacterium]